jgi:uncharacterized protein YeaO (DUF488 family)
MPNLGPSEALFRLARHGKISWAEFKRRYRWEILKGDNFEKQNRTIKNHGQKFTLRLLQYLSRRRTITLMCHCDEQQQYCHRHILKSILDGKV